MMKINEYRSDAEGTRIIDQAHEQIGAGIPQNMWHPIKIKPLSGAEVNVEIYFPSKGNVIIRRLKNYRPSNDKKERQAHYLIFSITKAGELKLQNDGWGEWETVPGGDQDD